MQIVTCQEHALHQLQAEQTNRNYQLRPSRSDRQLQCKTNFDRQS